MCFPPDPAAGDVGRSCSLACSIFLNVIPSCLKKRHTAPQLAGVPRSASSATTARKVRSGFSAIRINSHSRSLVSRSGRRLPIGCAALPVARQSGNHFTTLATLTPNSAADAPQVRPLATEATTRLLDPVNRVLPFDAGPQPQLASWITNRLQENTFLIQTPRIMP
jgi:hypothetical protein